MAGKAESNPDPPVIVIFRHDLRIADNGALSAAAETGRRVLPVFVFDEAKGLRTPGAASLWWLHHSLTALAKDLRSLGARLVLRRGSTARIVDAIVKETGADAVFWNRRYEPAGVEADGAMKAELRHRGLKAQSFDGALLHEPSLLKTGSGGPYRVYTPFWRALGALSEWRDPIDAPKSLRGFSGKFESDHLHDWRLLPTEPDWAAGFGHRWMPGEAGAKKRLDHFLSDALQGYGDSRDIPAIDGTSGLSPHLAFGEITPFQIFAALKRRSMKAPAADIEKFRKEVGWREFCYHLLFHHPDLATRNYNRDFDGFAWHKSARLLKAWQRGQTGYPIVDAGMRELWQTGVMHNRVRMIAASFLIKHLLIDWREGEAWFWDTLVDADAANNPANWQWVAGSGADASPYFRIFNPVLQGEKFDKDGTYVRRFVPELANLPAKFIQCPWKAPAEVLGKAGVKLGATYPVPVVDHDEARQRAMQAYRAMRGTI
ncbi:MAG: deoxyribodipyrimidine photo-lyase [Hyphomicrobiales bacterium]